MNVTCRASDWSVCLEKVWFAFLYDFLKISSTNTEFENAENDISEVIVFLIGICNVPLLVKVATLPFKI